MTKSSAAPRRLKIVKIVIFSSSFKKIPKIQPSALLVRASYNLKHNNIYTISAKFYENTTISSAAPTTINIWHWHKFDQTT